jgi:GxxExxY protein
MTEVVYKELSYRMVGCFYKVYNTLGPGHKEDVYQKALIIEFEKNRIKYISKKKFSIEYEGKKIGTYEPDFIVEDKIIVEIKSVFIIPKVFEKQLYYYLKGSSYRLGYLVNFGSDRIDIRRRVN